jgi:hypothetical protein
MEFIVDLIGFEPVERLFYCIAIGDAIYCHVAKIRNRERGIKNQGSGSKIKYKSAYYKFNLRFALVLSLAS